MEGKKELAQTGRQKAKVRVRVGDRPTCLEYTGKSVLERDSGQHCYLSASRAVPELETL